MSRKIAVSLLAALALVGTHDVEAQQGKIYRVGVIFRGDEHSADTGLTCARYVQRILTGAIPNDLPVESLSRVQLAVNLNTARDMGVTIPQAVRLSASEVIQ